MTELVDPQLAAWEAQDPSQFLSQTNPPPIPQIAPLISRQDVERDLAVAIVVMAGLVVRELASQKITEDDDVAEVARGAWRKHVPLWMRLVGPAIKHVYALGRVEGLTDDELEHLATVYAGTLGDYVNQTSSTALAEGVQMQLNQRWSWGLARQRATAGYGLDSQQMRTYLLTTMKQGETSTDVVPAVGRELASRLLLRRAENIGRTEAYTAEQTGKATAWLYLYQQGRLPGATRGWELGPATDHDAVCLELAKQRVAPDQPFVLPDGSTIWAPRAHPGCQCRVVLHGVDDAVIAKLWESQKHPRGQGGQFAAIGGATVAVGAAVGGALLARRFHVPSAAAKATPKMIAVVRQIHPDVETVERMTDQEARAYMHTQAHTIDYHQAVIGDMSVTAMLQHDLKYPEDKLRQEGYERAFRRLLGAADPEVTPELHRGMSNVEHHVGDVIDFGEAASWTSNPATARNYAVAAARGGPETRGIYTVPAKAVPAVPLRNTSLHEWLTGGSYRVTGKRVIDSVTHYDLEPVQNVGKAITWQPGKHPRDQLGHWASEHKVAIVLGAGYAGAVLGVKFLPVATAGAAAHAMKDEARAARMADTLARHQGDERHFVLYSDGPEASRAIRDLHAKALRANPDINLLRIPTSEFTQSFHRAAEIRSAPRRANLRNTQKARDTYIARALSRVIAASDPKQTPDLYRSMHVLGDHKVGDVIDFGDFASFSSSHSVARDMGKLYEQVLKEERERLEATGGHVAPKGATQRIYRVPGGQIHAMSIGAAGRTPTHTAMEWLAGGKYRVVGVTHQFLDPSVYHLEPITDGPVSKAGAVSVAGLAVIAADTGRLLMLQRALSDGDPAGGMWEFPGGHLERGETPMDGARREWEEEVRRRLPTGRPMSSWRAGIYEGFTYLIPREADIPTHSRGRVVNPDDPDGDAVEAIAWWDLAHLTGSRAVRPELRAALDKVRDAYSESLHAPSGGAVAKAFGTDPYDRDYHGRFASHEGRRSQATVERPVPADNQLITLLRQIQEPSSLTAPAAAKPLTRGKPLTSTRSLTSTHSLTATSSLTQQAQQVKAEQAQQMKISIKLKFPELPAPKGPRPDGSAFYLPSWAVQTYYDEMWGGEIGAHFGEPMVNFGDIKDFYVEESAVSGDDPRDARIEATWAHSPWDAVGPQVDWYNDHEWNDLMDRATPIWHRAVVEHEDVLARMDDWDLRLIAARAFRGENRSGDAIRQMIADNITDPDAADHSLRDAYADYVTFGRPDFVEDGGEEFDRFLVTRPEREIIESEPPSAFRFRRIGASDSAEDLHANYHMVSGRYLSAIAERDEGRSVPDGHLNLMEIELDPDDVGSRE